MELYQHRNGALDRILSMIGMSLLLADIMIVVQLQHTARHLYQPDLPNDNPITSHLTMLLAVLKVLLLIRVSAPRRLSVIRIMQVEL